MKIAISCCQESVFDGRSPGFFVKTLTAYTWPVVFSTHRNTSEKRLVPILWRILYFREKVLVSVIFFGYRNINRAPSNTIISSRSLSSRLLFLPTMASLTKVPLFDRSSIIAMVRPFLFSVKMRQWRFDTSGSWTWRSARVELDVPKI